MQLFLFGLSAGLTASVVFAAPNPLHGSRNLNRHHLRDAAAGVPLSPGAESRLKKRQFVSIGDVFGSGPSDDGSDEQFEMDAADARYGQPIPSRARTTLEKRHLGGDDDVDALDLEESDRLDDLPGSSSSSRLSKSKHKDDVDHAVDSLLSTGSAHDDDDDDELLDSLPPLKKRQLGDDAQEPLPPLHLKKRELDDADLAADLPLSDSAEDLDEEHLGDVSPSHLKKRHLDDDEEPAYLDDEHVDELLASLHLEKRQLDDADLAANSADAVPEK